MPKVTHAQVRMYRMGTGDCFAIKFFAGKTVACKMMIDAGTWSGSKKDLDPFITDLKKFFGNSVDILVVTHEHKDHVHAFDVCRDLFAKGKFKADQVWLGWTENDRVKKVKEWKDEYGEKKKALGIAATKLVKAMKLPEFKKQFAGSKDSNKMLGARQVFSNVLNGFAELHLSVDKNKEYKGGLAGMDVVKKDIVKNCIKYFKPGDVIREVANADGIRIYVLGPPELYDDVKKEAGGEGESYDHNKFLKESGAFGTAILNLDNSNGPADGNIMPFDPHYCEWHLSSRVSKEKTVMDEMNNLDKIKKTYEENDWRKIEFDWLYSSGSFALRMNGLTNNLSLAMAIEFEDSGRVMLFPGDAEFGSWASWHQIDWKDDDRKKKDGEELKPLTEDLLNRTVFYKVAHHLSHNGTAQRLGLEMMKHKDLAAMATLDYSVINDGWMSTMPNRALIRELLLRTKGRLMVMNEEKLFYDFNEEVPLTEKISEARNRMTTKELAEFNKTFKKEKLYLEFTIKA